MNLRPATVSDRQAELIDVARSLKGFMPDDEGLALLAAAEQACLSAHGKGCIVEIGAWCGKSATYLGAGAEAGGGVVFSLDHHHGSEENQAGWDHFDPELIDPSDGRLNTLPLWQRSIALAGLEQRVVGVVGDSSIVGAYWSTPIDLLFIDGGHGEEPAWADWHTWSPLVPLGRWIAIHDVFEHPEDGGRPPYELFSHALASGAFEEVGAQGSLRVIRRLKAN
ncbi:MAG: class I SAM-dependent methyltransferase [Actinobacteria bacterium]|nr:class I SAM-dependent methyltransferase [Actinomycetota bacterium]